MTAAPRRPYRASGRVASSFARWAAFGILLGAAFGLFESVIFAGGKPLLAAALTTGIGYFVGVLAAWVVRGGRCRRASVALCLGLLVGTATLASGWWVDLFMETGSASPLALQGYLVDRVESGRHDGLDLEGVPEGAARAAHWLVFSACAGFALFLVAGMAWRRVGSDPFCEACGAWMVRDVFGLPPQVDPENVRGALAAGQVGQMVERWGEAWNPGTTATVLAVDTCSRRKACDGSEAYLSMVHADARPRLLGPFHPSELLFGRPKVFVEPIAPGDLETLRPRLTSVHEGRAYHEPSAYSELLAGLAEASPAARTPGRVEDVEHREADTVLRRIGAGYGIVAQLLGFAVIFAGPLVGLALLEDWFPLPTALRTPIAVAVTVLWVLAIALLLRYPHFFDGPLIYSWARRAFGARPDPVVDVDDPEAFYVDIVPRGHWGRLMADNASDTGFLRVDADAKEIRFEGDRQRYVFPARSIRWLDSTTVGAQQRSSGIDISRYAAVLHVEVLRTGSTEEGARAESFAFVEVPLVLRRVSVWQALRWGLGGNHQRLERAIWAILPELEIESTDLAG